VSFPFDHDPFPLWQSMLRDRLLFGSLLTALLLGLFYVDHRLGSNYCVLLLALAFAPLCTFELLRMLDRNIPRPFVFLTVCTTLTVVLAEWIDVTLPVTWFPGWLADLPLGYVVFLLATCGFLFIPVGLGEKERIPHVVHAVFALVYVGLFFGCFVKISGMTAGGERVGLRLALTTLIICKFTDTGAYAFGRLLGKRKLAPSISPGKTLAGFFGGLVVGTAAGILCWHLLRLPHSVRLITLAFSFGAVSIIAQVGDLVESAMKRHAGVKDSGRTLWAFGGALDLADSVILASPVAYFVFLSIL
ncbi:MAG: phosphatidate cytidylyltransferase, partial [Planctomycetota bacterium]|nr:phosphatidate cytidylyltransferase [Planctomycetota bacterium]